MFRLKQVLSAAMLKELAESTADGLDRRDCFYDQFHYVNRRFVAKHFEQLAALVVSAVSELHPGVSIRDITYVNDFVSPVNLPNAAIHNQEKSNRYGWHSDAIDWIFRPCYNLWIPLYCRAALNDVDDRSVFDVLTPAGCPRFYDACGKLQCSVPWSPRGLPQSEREAFSKLVSVPIGDLDNYLYFHTGERVEKMFPSELTPVSVVRPRLGDCYVFDSSSLHASGPSGFERVGISIKFLLHNPALGFHILPHLLSPVGMGTWLGMFIFWYEQYGTFSAYQDVLDIYLRRERDMLDRNSTKLECVRAVLLQVARELAQLGVDP